VLVAASLASGSAARSQLLFKPSKVSMLTPSISTARCDVADVDQDGTLDLVSTSGSACSWSKGNGLGVFGAATTLPDLSGQFVRTVDLDGDGRRDVLAAGVGTTLQVALAQASGGFGAPVTLSIPSPGTSGRALESGDADGDGDLDVLVTTGPTAAFGGEARLFLNDGAGGLTPGPLIAGTVSTPVLGGQTGSIDGNAEPDLVVTTQAGSSLLSTVWLGQAGGGMQAGATVPGLPVTRIADLNGDGDADLLAPTGIPFDPVIVHTFLGDGAGGFSTGPATDTGVVLFGVMTAAVADLDGDAMLDLVLAVPGTPPEGWMLHGDGTGGFDVSDAHVSLLPSQGPTGDAHVVECADLDNDGRLDVLFVLAQPFLTNVGVCLNATYPQGGALLDLGHQLKGGNGYPIQIVSGSFVGGQPFSFSLAHGPVSGSVFHWLGFTVLNAPFKGGTMVPTPQVLSGPWPTTGAGTLLLAGNWPMGVPSGFQIAAQFWFPSAAVAGFAASSGVLVTMP